MLAENKKPSYVPTPEWEAFRAAWNLAEYKCPYERGGGHPSPGYTLGVPKSPKAFDCSGWAWDQIRHGGMTEGHKEALDTEELLSWGMPGQGDYMTLWVINQPHIIEHTFIEYKMPNYPNHRWSMAAHTGTICGWIPYMNPHSPFHYTPRRRKIK